MKRYERFFNYLRELGVRLTVEQSSRKIEVKGYMPLSIEVWADEKPGYYQVSLCHYGEQNGDLMRDPEVCFRVKIVEGRGIAIPCYFRNDYVGVEDIVKPGYRSPSLDSFCDSWFKNLREQAFFKTAKKEVEP